MQRRKGVRIRKEKNEGRNERGLNDAEKMAGEKWISSRSHYRSERRREKEEEGATRRGREKNIKGSF